MPGVRIRIPEVKPCPDGRPPACPFCQNPALHRWGSVVKPLLDPHLPQEGVVEEAWAVVRARPPDGRRRLFIPYRWNWSPPLEGRGTQPSIRSHLTPFLNQFTVPAKSTRYILPLKGRSRTSV